MGTLGSMRDVHAIWRYFERQRHAWEDGIPWTWCCPTDVRCVMPSYAGSDANEVDCYNDQRCIHTYVSAGFHRDGIGLSLVFDSLADIFLNANKMAPRISIVGARIPLNLSQAAGPIKSPRWRRQVRQVWRAPKAFSMPC